MKAPSPRWLLTLVVVAEGLLLTRKGSAAAGGTTKEALVASLHSLGAAVERGDVRAAEAISRQLVDEAKRRAPVEEHDAHPNLTSSTDSAHFAQREQAAAKVDQVPQGGCLIDDHLFSLSPEDKAALGAELQTPKMLEAVDWVQHGGWWVCAQYGEHCSCRGNVRMAYDDRQQEFPVKVAAVAPGYSVHCDLSSFGGVDIAPGVGKICECEHVQTPFHLHKRLTSTSILQEAWIYLLRLLSRAHLMPLGTGDRTFHGMENWAARHAPNSMPMVLERYWIDLFIKQVVAPSTTAKRCLEWGDPSTPGQGFNYANSVPSCSYKMDVQYDAVHYGLKGLGVEGNIVYSDVDHMPQVLTAQGDQRVDLIFATQVFEHLYNPHEAVMRLFESLLPGGVLVYTAPQQAQFHLVPHDFFRYTKEGVLYMMQSAGFCVPAWGFAGGGDFVFDIARDAGLQMQDFPMEEMWGGFQRGYDEVSDSAITIHALGFKPPHSACDQAMPLLTPTKAQ